MTPTEAALGLREWFEVFRRRGKGNEPTVKEFLEAADLIEKLDKRVPRWISVEERLPEVDKRYGEYEYSAELLVYDGLRRRSAYYCHTSGVWYDSRYEDDTFEVTHYMPLPELPKEE